jgi:hypothetical protein
MSGTRRTPVARRSITPITPRAVELYLKMRRLRCSCPPPGREYWKRPTCASCEKWWNLHRELDRELAPRPPWIWPHLNPPTLYPNHDGVLVQRVPIDHQVETARRLREAAKAMRAIQRAREVTIDVNPAGRGQPTDDPELGHPAEPLAT